MKKILTLAATVMLLFAANTNASIIQASSGLATSESHITFDELVFSQDTAITNQYSPFGVTFSESNGASMKYDTQGNADNLEGIDGHYIGNFNPVLNPFSILFNETVFEASFALATNPASTTISAYLNGALVESSSFSTRFDNPNAYFQLTGISFDEIQVEISSDLGLIDNIQFSTAAIPEPTAMMIWGLFGAAGIAGFRRRK